MENKITYAQALTVAIETVADEEIRERLVALKSSLEKKSGSKKISEKEVATRNGIKTTILEVLSRGKKTVTEILKEGDFEVEVSSQKISAMLKKMLEEDKTVDKAKEGKSMYYFLVATNEGEDE